MTCPAPLPDRNKRRVWVEEHPIETDEKVDDMALYAPQPPGGYATIADRYANREIDVTLKLHVFGPVDTDRPSTYELHAIYERLIGVDEHLMFNGGYEDCRFIDHYGQVSSACRRACVKGSVFVDVVEVGERAEFGHARVGSVPAMVGLHLLDGVEGRCADTLERRRARDRVLDAFIPVLGGEGDRKPGVGAGLVGVAEQYQLVDEMVQGATGIVRPVTNNDSELGFFADENTEGRPSEPVVLHREVIRITIQPPIEFRVKLVKVGCRPRKLEGSVTERTG